MHSQVRGKKEKIKNKTSNLSGCTDQQSGNAAVELQISVAISATERQVKHQ